MRKPREELVKRGVLLEDPEQGESAPELLLRLSVFCVAHLPLPAPPPCSSPSRGGKFKGSYFLTWFLSVCLALLAVHLAKGRQPARLGRCPKKRAVPGLGIFLLPAGVLHVPPHPVPRVRVLVQPPRPVPSH